MAEVSSFQLEWVDSSGRRSARLLNVTPTTSTGTPSFAEYRDAKARLFAAQERRRLRGA